jgi:hypothetical protein
MTLEILARVTKQRATEAESDIHSADNDNDNNNNNQQQQQQQ